jgi:hypothetical protein
LLVDRIWHAIVFCDATRTLRAGADAMTADVREDSLAGHREFEADNRLAVFEASLGNLREILDTREAARRSADDISDDEDADDA